MKPRTLQDRAKAARLRAGFRVPQEAADAIGCSRPLVVAWETGSAKSIGSKYLLDAAKAYKVRPEWLNLESDDDGYPWSPDRVREAQQEYGSTSQPEQLNLAKLAAAQKFLEDLFRGEGVRFVASEQTMLLAAVYQELMTESEPNIVEMAGRIGKKVRGQQGERQGATGSTLADDREGTGEGGRKAGTKVRKAG